MCFIHIMSTVLQTGYLPSFDCKLGAGKRVRPPPPPTHPIHLTASWRAGKRVRPPPPTPLPRLGSARAICGHLVARCMCVGGGESARHGGRGWDARQIFATNREGGVKQRYISIFINGLTD